MKQLTNISDNFFCMSMALCALLSVASWACSPQHQKQNKKQHERIPIQIKNILPEKKIGQLFILGFEGPKADTMLQKWITKRNLGGVAIFGKNVTNEKQLINLVQSIKTMAWKHNQIKIFVATDHEPGYFMSIRIGKTLPNLSRLPKYIETKSNRQITLHPNTKIAIQTLADDLITWGFNMNLHPVLDVLPANKKSPLRHRIFSDNPKWVAQWGLANILIFQKANIISVAKHFPGHGDTNTDSHYHLPIINKSKNEMLRHDLIPFEQAIRHGIPAIMPGHIFLPLWDANNPVPMSKKILQNYVRQQLNFQGILISDDISMYAIKKNFPLPLASYKMILAGMDMILITRFNKGIHSRENIFQFLLKKYSDDKVFQQRVDESYRRIQRIKQLYFND